MAPPFRRKPKNIFGCMVTFDKNNPSGSVTSSQVISKAAHENLNSIRALSGLIVVFSHYFQLFILPVEGRNAVINITIASGEYAVLAFFVLSGYLIAYSIESNIEKYGYFEWREYLMSRVTRIYPTLIASVLFCLLLYGILNFFGLSNPGGLRRISDVYPASRSEFSISHVQVLSTLLQTYAFAPGGYISVNGPLWSLSYEVGFYLIAGLIVTMVCGRSPKITPLLGLIVIAAVCTISEKFLFLHFGSIWMLGVGLFIVIHKSSNNAIMSKIFLCQLNRYRYAIYLLINILIVNVVLMLAGLKGAFMHNLFSAILISTGIYYALKVNYPIFSVVANLSNSTYTLYLFHFPLMLFFYAFIRDIHDQSPFIYFVSSIAVAFGLIPFCHYLARYLENKKWWEHKIIQTIRSFNQMNNRYNRRK